MAAPWGRTEAQLSPPGLFIAAGVALGAMLWANRSLQRLVWFCGAALMAVVLAKLFLVDLARIGTVPRIVSFLGVGGQLAHPRRFSALLRQCGLAHGLRELLTALVGTGLLLRLHDAGSLGLNGLLRLCHFHS